MDVNMPIMDGFQATRAIRSLQEEGVTDKCPILGLTAYTGDDFKRKCKDSGMNKRLKKPLSKDKLLKSFRDFNLIE